VSEGLLSSPSLNLPAAMRHRVIVSFVALLASLCAAVVSWDGRSRPLAEAAASAQIQAFAAWK